MVRYGHTKKIVEVFNFLCGTTAGLLKALKSYESQHPSRLLQSVAHHSQYKYIRRALAFSQLQISPMSHYNLALLPVCVLNKFHFTIPLCFISKLAGLY